jgi:uncharacterized protein (TIGR02996 family)
MTDRDALYRAILANPEDDTPRLVYADWLEENGRAEEAEFIRVECRLETIAPDDSAYGVLFERQIELSLWLSTHAPGPTVRLPAGLQFRGGADWWNRTSRGFPRFLIYSGHGRPGLKPVRAVGAALEKAFTKLPARWLVVQGLTVAQLAELLKQPAVAQLNGLTIGLDAPDEAEAEACRSISECSNLARLHALSLEFPIGVQGATALSESRSLSGLSWLSLENCEWLNPAAVACLHGANWFRNLLRLSTNGLSSESFEELSRRGPLRVQTLEMDQAAFEPAAWRTFARSGTFPLLARLVNNTDMSRGRAEALAATDHIRLSHLDMTGSAIGNDGAEALAAAPWLDSLVSLSLSSNRLGPAGVAAIAQSRRLAQLRVLRLGYNAIGGVGLRKIAANPALRGLITLGLGNYGNASAKANHQLTASDFAAFLAELDIPNLRYLDLSGRPVGPRAVQFLTRESFGNLTRLDLSECKLTDTAVSALLTAPTLQNLIELDVSKNGLKDGLSPFTDRRCLPRLAVARVSGNRLSRELERKLARRPGVYL